MYAEQNKYDEIPHEFQVKNLFLKSSSKCQVIYFLFDSNDKFQNSQEDICQCEVISNCNL